MAPRKRYRYSLSGFLDRTCRRGWGFLACFSLAGSLSVSLYGQQVEAPATNAAIPQVQSGNAVDSGSDEGSEQEVGPAIALQPGWLFSTDSDGNIRNRLKLESSLAAGRHDSIGLLVGEGLISNPASNGNTEKIRDAGLIGQWHLNQVLKVEGMFGVSLAGATTNSDGQQVEQAFIPITKLQAHFTPAEEALKLDLGFERSIYDLSPQLVANRVVRNQFVIRPQLVFTSGWRARALAEIGPMTRPDESNARYNSEFTIGHKVGKKSELYSTYGLLHYAHASDAGYFSPNLVHNLQGGWSGDIDRGPFSLSLDLALGADRAEEHGSSFGPWGVSAGVGSYLTWTIGENNELNASYEYYYDQSSPAVQTSSSGAWHMSIVSLSFRWATNGRHGTRDAQLPVSSSRR
jgi:hypothetical protein